MGVDDIEVLLESLASPPAGTLRPLFPSIIHHPSSITHEQQYTAQAAVLSSRQQTIWPSGRAAGCLAGGWHVSQCAVGGLQQSAVGELPRTVTRRASPGAGASARYQLFWAPAPAKRLPFHVPLPPVRHPYGLQDSPTTDA